MPRRPRVDFPGAFHHVMHRGARREPVFFSENLCLDFLDLLCDLHDQFELETHAYALMGNHYHLLVRSRHGNLSAAMRHLDAAYTQKANRARGFDGPLFRGRFRSQLLSHERSLPIVFAYIHLNPLQARLVTRLQSATWTSYRYYLGRDRPPAWLTLDHFLRLFGGSEPMHRYVLDLHRGKEPWPEDMRMESGWLRTPAAVSDADVQIAGTSRLLEAETVLEGVCAACACTADDLRRVVRGPRANPSRRFAVWALRRHTRLTQREIGQVLHMTTQQVANVLRRIQPSEEPFASWVRDWRLLCDK